ncbi:HD domain-containing phosphohydrolase [Maridesulfovibrio hydrothermalis]|uniref:Response regulator receiver modulated metal dependent phosphohydrolase n=1 Tax=Maridesulfovibrio hydrothermalis AM13 = DSM 14728 TaxID=1121451 RepID=L0R9U5_9BACT|nr:HD domain-containing phosphohydrolase [Maridesulfovibrio hydrothermalis]CCO23553.1 Response regulator receiver modulated metal dependent phosphohydrolase [Maridesulfovibrio hydrothermalis AM13 = DSM 14728]
MDNSELTILVIDDEAFVRETISDYLSDSGFEILGAGDGEEGLDVFRKESPDAVLVDLNMPKVDGFEVLKEISAESPDTPIIVVSGAGLIQDAIKAVRLGAWDFVTKPIVDLKILEHALGQGLERASLIAENRRYKEHLEAEVEKRTEDLRHEVKVRREAQEAFMALQDEVIETQKEIILTLGEVVETRSNETANHVRRVAELSYILARRYGLEKEEADLLRLASPMHDVGKIGIPDTILNKPGKLTPDEIKVIQTHTTIGHEILKHSERPIIKAAAIVAYEHHERWDGTGYPQGLSGEEINIYGRITGIADVFDALGSERVYKKAWSIEKIKGYFAEGRGKQFDPQLTDLFFDGIDEILELRRKHPDG